MEGQAQQYSDLPPGTTSVQAPSDSAPRSEWVHTGTGPSYSDLPPGTTQVQSPYEGVSNPPNGGAVSDMGAPDDDTPAAIPEGQYSMALPNGQTISVPYGQVEQAKSQGAKFADIGTLQQYARDYAVDPKLQSPAGNFLTNAPWWNVAADGGNLAAGIGGGVESTLAGLDTIARKATGTANGPLSKPEEWLQQQAATPTQGVLQGIGDTAEGVGEFVLGDAALKGLSVSERFMQAAKITKAVEDSPTLGRIANAGIRALRSGTVGATESGIKTGDPATAATTGLLTGMTAGAAPEVERAAQGAFNTLKTVIKPGIIQDAFQGQIRDIINDVAQESGVPPSTAMSIRDVAQDVSDGFKQKAQQAYQALDDATGGRVQRFSDAIRVVQRKLTDLNGISSPDDEAAWETRLTDLRAAHEHAMQEAEGQGVPRTLLDQANTNYKTAMSMLDLSKQIRLSTEGLRPELAPGAKTPIPEKVNTSKLFPRAQKLYDSGRLQSGLGDERAGHLLQVINDAHAASQTAAALRAIIKRYGGWVATPPIAYGSYELMRHMLGE